MSKVVIAGNGVVTKSILKQLENIDSKGTEVVSNFEELDTLVKDMLSEEANKLPSIEEYIQEINNSTKQLRFDTPAQNCKKNFKRKRFFNI